MYSSTSTIVLECARALCVYSVVIVQECYSGAYAICAILTAGPLVYYSVVVIRVLYSVIKGIGCVYSCDYAFVIVYVHSQCVIAIGIYIYTINLL